MEYISREDATEALVRHSMHISNTWQTDYRGEVAGIDMAICIIEDLPAADVIERKRGEWIHDYHYGLALPEHKCSICGEWEYSDKESNFCPNCGAKMEGNE